MLRETDDAMPPMEIPQNRLMSVSRASISSRPYTAHFAARYRLTRKWLIFALILANELRGLVTVYLVLKGAGIV